MTKTELFNIYKTVAESKKRVTPDDVAGKCELTDESVRYGLHFLERAGLIREHLIGGEVSYARAGVEFFVYDARREPYILRGFDEALNERRVSEYWTIHDLALHENLQQFLLRVLIGKDKKTVSSCLLPPPKFDIFCKKAVPTELEVVDMTPERAAEIMREKYFTAMCRSRLQELEARKK